MTKRFSASLVTPGDGADLLFRTHRGDRAAVAKLRSITHFLSELDKRAHTARSPICGFAPCERELHHRADVAAMLVIAPHNQKEKNSRAAVCGVCADCMRRWQKLSPAEATQKISAVVRLMVPDAQLDNAPLSAHATRHGGSE